MWCQVSLSTVLQHGTIPLKFTISLQDEHLGRFLNCTSLTKTTSTGLANVAGTDPVSTTSTGLTTATGSGRGEFKPITPGASCQWDLSPLPITMCIKGKI